MAFRSAVLDLITFEGHNSQTFGINQLCCFFNWNNFAAWYFNKGTRYIGNKNICKILRTLVTRNGNVFVNMIIRVFHDKKI